MGRRRTATRRKCKKGVNRYDPNNPDWNAVHRPSYMAPKLSAALPLNPFILLGALKRGR